MPDDRTVLDHLLEGRDALVLEVARLSSAIGELDAVIGQIGGGRERLGDANGNGHGGANGSVNGGAAPVAPPAPVVAEPIPAEPVNPPVEVEPTPKRRAPARARKVTPRKSTSRRSAARQTEAPKSIRVHVLEMLAAEDREFGLAEIIDRVHGAGIQAHDDAVRSITIKLMKDGRVERVGRGQYRLAQRGSARHAARAADAAQFTGTPAAADSAPDTEPADAEPADTAPADTAPADTAPADTAPESPEPADPNERGDGAAETSTEAPATPPNQPTSPFTPPLNLGQPWERG